MFKVKNLLLVISTVLLVIFLNLGGMEKSRANAETSNFAIYQADELTQSGQKLLDQGQAKEALLNWEEATKIYRRINYQEGVTGSLINQSLALRDLGLNLRACSTLLESLKLEAQGWLCNSSLYQPVQSPLEVVAVAVNQVTSQSVNIVALQNLGDSLRSIGKLEESELVLQKALDRAKSLVPPSNTSAITLSLANTERAIFNQLRDKYSEIEDFVKKQNTLNTIQQKALLARQLYYQIFASNDQILELRSRLNCLSLLIDTEKWSAKEIRPNHPELSGLLEFNRQIQQQIRPLIENIEGSPTFSQLPLHQSTLVQLNFAFSLARLHNPQLIPTAVRYVESALQQAKSTGNLRLQSSGWGILASLTEGMPAQVYLEEASGFARSARASDLLWQWESKLASLYQEQGQYEKAIVAYQTTIKSLQDVRSNLLSINPDVQYSFRDTVAPIYRNYVELLLKSPNSNIEEVIAVNSQLQVAELENFLRCGRLNLVPLSNIKVSHTTVRIITLKDRVEVILQLPIGRLYHHSADYTEVENALNNLLPILQDLRFAEIHEPAYLPPAQTLYNLLLAPIKSYLPSSGNLVFDLDSSFRSLPMGVLHDGQKFLLERYSISLTLGSQLRQPKLLKKEQLKVIFAGLSQVSPSFNDPNAPVDLSSLPATITEAANVKRFAPSFVELLDENFTTKRFQQEISRADYSIVHISTHGEFSSDPNKTVLLDWDAALNISQINNLLQENQGGNGTSSIELLVLSACQTAKGDRRSALGIAGVAAQAGARATIASLWYVDSESTAALMGYFYQELAAELPKASALQQAQLKLQANPRYRNPYYWAGFVLVGSWL